MNSFQCSRCSVCCRQPGFVYLQSKDVDRLAGFLKMDPYDFTEQYGLLRDRMHLVLKKNPDETCLFLGEQGCAVYEARPQQCRDFPMQWKTERSLDYCQGLGRKDGNGKIPREN